MKKKPAALVISNNNKKAEPFLLREDEVGVLINFLESVPLSGFQSKTHGILVTLLRRMRMYRGDYVELDKRYQA